MLKLAKIGLIKINKIKRLLISMILMLAILLVLGTGLVVFYMVSNMNKWFLALFEALAAFIASVIKK